MNATGKAFSPQNLVYDWVDFATFPKVETKLAQI